MTEYAIIVAVVAISAITAFKYFGGVQRSQVAAITQELAGQESGGTLALAQSYASRARNAAGRDLGLGDYYAGGGSYGGGGMCPISPARAAQKASGTNYVWAVSDGAADCTEPEEPLVKAVYLSDELDFIKTVVEDFGVLQMFESYFPDGKTIRFKVDNSISGSMQVTSTDPDTILVNVDMLTGPDNLLEARHLASIVGHEIVHVYDINYRKQLGLAIDNRFRWQSEINATTWQVNHFAKLGIVSKEPFDSNYQFRRAVEQYRMKAMHCSMNPTAGDCL